MVRILSSGMREIDIDFGEVQVDFSRLAGDVNANTLTTDRIGADQLINTIATTTQGVGSFIQYQRIDLDYMVQNNEVLIPQSVTVQRTSPVPLGGGVNENLTDQIEEYIFILSRPLDNQILANYNNNNYQALRRLGLDAVTPLGSSGAGGNKGGWPSKIQTIYAEKRMYDMNLNNIATTSNGQLNPRPTPPALPAFDSISGMPSLANVSTWGSLGPITGPNLHCYRVVIDRRQTMIADFYSTQLAGSTNSQWPAVNVSFICADPKATEGEYITAISNAMNTVPIGEPVAL